MASLPVGQTSHLGFGDVTTNTGGQGSRHNGSRNVKGQSRVIGMSSLTWLSKIAQHHDSVSRGILGHTHSFLPAWEINK